MYNNSDIAMTFDTKAILAASRLAMRMRSDREDYETLKIVLGAVAGLLGALMIYVCG